MRTKREGLVGRGTANRSCFDCKWKCHELEQKTKWNLYAFAFGNCQIQTPLYTSDFRGFSEHYQSCIRRKTKN